MNGRFAPDEYNTKINSLGISAGCSPVLVRVDRLIRGNAGLYGNYSKGSLN